MNKKLIICVTCSIVCTFSMHVYAQSWSTGTNKLYTNPSSTNVGIGTSSPSERLHIDNGALKIGNSTEDEDRTINVLKFGDGDYVKIGEWEEDDHLSFKANKYNFTKGNVGIGVSNPLQKLDVNGKVYLRTVETINDWARSYLQWEAHKLVMGVPAGNYAHTLVEIEPGGCSGGVLFSQLSLYHAYSDTSKVEKIRFCTGRDCWINTTDNVGIGTNNPLYKLDVRGTIRADEILVNNVNGADFVFESKYNLRPLNEVNSYIQENRHLPEIPSAEEMRENGVNMNKLQIQLLQKIEELTLYIIQQEQRIKDLENQLSK